MIENYFTFWRKYWCFFYYWILYYALCNMKCFLLIKQVLEPPNWRTHLMEDKLTRPIFGWMPSEKFVAYSTL